MNLKKGFLQLFLAMATLVAGLLSASWHALLWLIDTIDGGEEDTDDVPTDQVIHYNHRTGDIDPVKRLDGLYDDPP